MLAVRANPHGWAALAACGVLVFADLCHAKSGDKGLVEPEIREAITRMQQELSAVRFYAGKVVIKPDRGTTVGEDKQTVLRFTIGSSPSSVRVSYDPVRLPSGTVVGSPLTRLETAQTRFYDTVGAVVVKRGRAERLTSDYQLDSWATKESFVGSAQLIANVLADLGSDEGQASSTSDLGVRGWDVNPASGDKYVLDRGAKASSSRNLSGGEFFSMLPRRMRLASKYGYRPDLILVMTGTGETVWECWRIDWADVMFVGKRMWFPSKVRREWYNPLERQGLVQKPHPLWTAETSVDLASLSSVVPVSLIGPKLPPGAPPRIRTSAARQTTRNEVASRFADEMGSLASQPTGSSSPPRVVSSVGSEDSGLARSWRVLLLSAAIFAAMIVGGLVLSKWRRARV